MKNYIYVYENNKTLSTSNKLLKLSTLPPVFLRFDYFCDNKISTEPVLISSSTNINKMIGFVDDNGHCVDMDECSSRRHDCSVNADCFNTAGSFECSCKNGFVGNGVECEGKIVQKF
jgi:hypothetical protein